ncbi:MAG: O-antigen ligase family protein, partial [Telluria sp.]
MNNNLIKMMDPRQALIAALIFLFPFLSLITDFGVSLSSFTFVLAAPFFLKPGRAALARHWPEIRWVVFAFAFNFLYALLLFLVRDGATLPMLEKPVRMLFAVSALMLVLVLKPDRKLLWWGVIAGALAGALLVGYQRAELDLDRPGGLINPITFGDLSLCLGLVALAATLDFRRAHRAIWPGLGAIAGLL